MTEFSQADESVARRFSRSMNASTSPFGLLSDPAVASVLTAVLIFAFLGADRLDASRPARLFAVLVPVPIVVAVGATIGLSRARRRIVSWLQSVPFPVENLNAILNGVGDLLEVEFVDAVPSKEVLNEALDALHTDCFVTKAPENEADPRTMELRIGVFESRVTPIPLVNYRRYERVRAIVEVVLVPVSEQFTIAAVRIK